MIRFLRFGPIDSIDRESLGLIRCSKRLFVGYMFEAGIDK